MKIRNARTIKTNKVANTDTIMVLPETGRCGGGSEFGLYHLVDLLTVDSPVGHPTFSLIVVVLSVGAMVL